MKKKEEKTEKKIETKPEAKPEIKIDITNKVLSIYRKLPDYKPENERVIIELCKE